MFNITLFIFSSNYLLILEKYNPVKNNRKNSARLDRYNSQPSKYSHKCMNTFDLAIASETTSKIRSFHLKTFGLFRIETIQKRCFASQKIELARYPRSQWKLYPARRIDIDFRVEDPPVSGQREAGFPTTSKSQAGVVSRSTKRGKLLGRVTARILRGRESVLSNKSKRIDGTIALM